MSKAIQISGVTQNHMQDPVMQDYVNISTRYLRNKKICCWQNNRSFGVISDFVHPSRLLALPIPPLPKGSKDEVKLARRASNLNWGPEHLKASSLPTAPTSLEHCLKEYCRLSLMGSRIAPVLCPPIAYPPAPTANENPCCNSQHQSQQPLSCKGPV